MPDGKSRAAFDVEPTAVEPPRRCDHSPSCLDVAAAVDMTMRHLIVLAVIAVLVVGCRTSATQVASSPDSTKSSPSSPLDSAVTTRACPASFVIGILVRSGASLAIDDEADRSVRDVIWSPEFEVRDDQPGLIVVDTSGVPVAAEGDRVRLNGGEWEDGRWYACGGIEVLREQ